VSAPYPTNPGGMGANPHGEPYASAPMAGGTATNPYADYQPIHTEAPGTVGGAYRAGLDHAARSGVAVQGTRRQDGAFMFPGTEKIDRQRVFAGPGYLSPRPPRSAVATPAVWISAIGLVIFPLLAVGILLGVIGLRETRDGQVSGRAASRAAVTLGSMGAVIWLMFWIVTQMTAA